MNLAQVFTVSVIFGFINGIQFSKDCPNSCTCGALKTFYPTVKCRNISSVPHGIPLHTVYLFLANNKIRELRSRAFDQCRYVFFLFLENNRIEVIRTTTFVDLYTLQVLSLYNNPIKIIEDGSFLRLMSHLSIVNLLDTQPNTPFMIYPQRQSRPYKINMIYMVLSGRGNERLYDLNIVKLALPNETLAVLQSTGYICILNVPKTSTPFYACKPCRRGMYKSLEKNSCYPCPPGGFYQDQIGFTDIIFDGLGCKPCQPGTYVSPETAPATAESDCRACPIGTSSKHFARYRACRCLEDHYRLDRFGPCYVCLTGYVCLNEGVALAEGFFFVWKSNEIQDKYYDFVAELNRTTSNYIMRQFSQDIPKPYACPFEGSCLGGRNATCAQGYEGPLCAVCSKGHINVLGKCQKCPTLPWIAGQMALLLGILVVFLFVCLRKQNQGSSDVRSMNDIMMARIKIVIGFYQISSTTFDSLSYIRWPASMASMIKYTKIIQLNLLQIVPVHCLDHSFHANAYLRFNASVGFTAALICISLLIAAADELHRRTYGEETRSRQKVKASRRFCHQSVIIILFITYPSASGIILQMLPTGCHQICPTNSQEGCASYMAADYSVNCGTPKHSLYSIMSIFAVVYTIGFPLTLFILLKRAFQSVNNRNDKRKLTSLQNLKFLYENYSTNCWFWEIIELNRKVFFASLLVLMDPQSRTSLGLTSIFSGMYTVLFALHKPMKDLFEHWLQIVSLMANSANFTIGMLLKIPVSEVSSGMTRPADSVGVTSMLLIVNTIVVLVLVVKYFYSVFTTLQNIKNNPRCSVSCCLEVIQLASDVQDDVSVASNKNFKTKGI